MSSAVTGLHDARFGMDEPMGCYDDIDHADVFVLWGNNMAEMHPVLFSRLLERRLKNPDVKIIDLATRTTRTSMAADRTILFKPADRPRHRQRDLPRDHPERLGATGVRRATTCPSTRARPTSATGSRTSSPSRTSRKTITLERYRELLAGLHAGEGGAALRRARRESIRYLASLYGDPKRKVMSLWCMGINQHTRGTWINNLVYNIHLLVGKIATPGNSPFSLTGQPSACGTVREVGHLTNRLPHGEVTNEKSRKMAAEIWGVPAEHIPAKPTYHTIEMFRALDRGDIRFCGSRSRTPW